jgi:hypothetical protein
MNSVHISFRRNRISFNVIPLQQQDGTIRTQFTEDIDQSTHHVYMQFILITKHKHMYIRFITSGFLSLPGKKYLLIGNDCHLIHKDKRMCWNVNNITSNYSTN